MKTYKESLKSVFLLRMRTATVVTALCVFMLATGAANAVTYTDSSPQTTAGQDFIFTFSSVSPWNGGNGTLTVHARGDYSVSTSSEYLDWDIDGLVSDRAAPSAGGTVIQTFSGNDIEWEQSFVISGGLLNSITSDSSIAISIDLDSSVNYQIDPSKHFVEVELTYNASGPQCLLPPEPYNPDPCDGDIEVPVDTCLAWNIAGCSQLCDLINGGFETGAFSPWTTITGPGDQLTPWSVTGNGSGFFGNGFPFEGGAFAQNGFDGDAGLFYDIYQEVAIPACASAAVLNWSERIQWNTSLATLSRNYEVTVQPAGGGSPLAVLYAMQLLPGTTGDTGYVPHSIDLLSVAPGIAGQTVRINFHEYIPERYTGPAQFDLDGISLNCGGGVPPPPPPPPPQSGQIVINELYMGSGDWLELFNPTGSAVELTGWRVTAKRTSSTTVLTIPPFTLAAGAYVVLHETSGVDTPTDLYLNQNIWWTHDTGSCALVDAGGVGIDFVRWYDSTGTTPSTDLPPVGTNWTGNDPWAPLDYIDTLGRDGVSTDTDNGGDWENTSGIDANGKTPGTSNVGGITITSNFAEISELDTDDTTQADTLDSAALQAEYNSLRKAALASQNLEPGLDEYDSSAMNSGESQASQGERSVFSTGCFTFGGADESFYGDSRLRANIITVIDQQTLSEINMELSFSGNRDLYFYVFESSSVNGPYTPVLEKVVPTVGIGRTFYSSGPTNFVLNPGTYYGIGVAWGAGSDVTYYRNLVNLPVPWNLGTVASHLYVNNGAPPYTGPISDTWPFAVYSLELCFVSEPPPPPCLTTWDVYLGTDPGGMGQVAGNLADPNYCPPGVLETGETYFWQVIAKNPNGETPGNIWSFETESGDPPNCNNAVPSVAEIWPPRHEWVDIEILDVNDPDGDTVSITITGITQDEPVTGLGSGKTSPDGMGVGTSIAHIRNERSGQSGNGRVYEISFEADDGTGNTCNGSVKVCVPNDQGLGHECVDDGQLYDSTATELFSADLNGDGIINLLDFNILSEYWLVSYELED